jgi:hypothetical protein
VLLRALDAIARFENDNGQMTRVNYGALDVEEFGSVYESLLDHEPIVDQGATAVNESGWGFRFSEGTARKTTGSYYTRPELVQELIKSALEPVIEERLGQTETDEEKVRELLSLKVCDPAAGSGHFLLAAARKISDHLVVARYGEDFSLMEQRLAMREVVKHCIYGVDLNPMAVELCKVALWLESYSVGLPLTFLDHHVKNGNSLVGVDDLKRLNVGIPDGAFKELLGDVKEVARKLKKRNKKEREKGKQTELQASVGSKEIALEKFAERLDEIDTMPERSVEETTRKRLAYQNFKQSREFQQAVTAANIWTGAFFIEKTEENVDKRMIATSSGLHSYIANPTGSYPPMTAKMDALAVDQKYFHWPLEYPEVFTKGGFDVVLGNPPWERIKLQEKEFFKGKDEDIATANKSKRNKYINDLKNRGDELYFRFKSAKQDAEKFNLFVRKSDRYSLTATGDINTYQLFSGLNRNLIKEDGRAGFIVPTGIATDKSNADFFGDLVSKKSILKLYDFENKEGIFEGVHRSYRFCLLTIGGELFEEVENLEAEFAFFLTQPNQLDNKLRRFYLTPEDFKRINPNTKTTPIFRTKPDAELTRKIHRINPVLYKISDKEDKEINIWGIKTKSTLHMSSNADYFLKYSDLKDKGAELLGNKFKIKNDIYYPVYESKMIHQYDFRFAEYDQSGENVNKISIDEKSEVNRINISRYWIKESKVKEKFSEDDENCFLLGFRKITRATDARTVIATIFPFTGLGDSINSLAKLKSKDALLLLSNLNSIVLDYFAKNSLSGINLSFWIAKQLPVINRERLKSDDVSFITSRSFELTHTSKELRPFAQSLDYNGEPFAWDEDRRALLKAELDAYYAKLYGLTREELLYILDPEAVYGEDFPGETFRVLKNKETKKYGEYLTKRLVLEAWDRLERGEVMMSEEEDYKIVSPQIQD